VRADFGEAIKMYSLKTGVPENLILEAIARALVQSYEKRYKNNVKVKVDKENNDIKVYSLKKVVEKVKSSIDEISLMEAQETNREVKLGDTVEVEINPEELGRIMAQSSHHMIMDNIKNIERDMLFDEFSEKKGQIVTGILQRRMKYKDIVVDLGKTDALLPVDQQMPRDKLKIGQKVKVLIKEVEKKDSRVRIIVSRTDPEFVRNLFKAEVPEISEGIVEIKAIARDAGERTKIAVAGLRDGVDPVGACVGMKGVRIQLIIRELDGEKIDIIRWSDNVGKLLLNLLSPAKANGIRINNEEKTAIVIVPNDQLSLAIGRDGVNVKLASKLLGWTIDIKSEDEFKIMMEDETTRKKIEELFEDTFTETGETYEKKKEVKEEKKAEDKKKKTKHLEEIEEEEEFEATEETSIEELPDISPSIIRRLKSAGYDTIESIIDLSLEDFSKISGIGKKSAEAIINSIRKNVEVIEEEE